ncbi:glycosyltransferase [Plantactinospora sp. ZYX-F-223]|uniref:glycosyltransferase n=1 Tax=Plantactinospora sp. ZYX-F-223 TaxID=3144103 RepID=UPI0031FD80AC
MDIKIDGSAILPGHSAGVEAFTYGLLRGLAADEAHRIEVTIVRGTRQSWRREVPDDARVRWTEVRQPLRPDAPLGGGLRRMLPRQLRSAPLAHRMVTRLRNRANPVAADDDRVTLYPFGGVPARARRSVVVVHDMRRFHLRYDSAPITDIFARNIAEADALVASWPHPYQQLLRTFPEVAAKTALIPLPVFHARPAGAASEPDPGLLLYPSSTAPHKNHLNLLEALTRLPELRLVCPGPLVEPQAGQLTARASAAELRTRVVFPGFVPVPALEQLYARATAVVVPSLWEAASGAIFEAFSWGLPVACADVEPLRAQVEFAGAEVCYFDPHDPDSIAAAVRRLLADRARYAAASRRAADRLATRTWTETARDYAAVLDWVAGGRSGPVPQSSFLNPDAVGGSPS